MSKNLTLNEQDSIGKALAEALGKALGDVMGTTLNATEARIGMKKDIEFIKSEVQEIKEIIKTQFVTKEQFEPLKKFVDEKLVTKEQFELIQKIVYGTISIILVTFITAVAAFFIQGHRVAGI